MSMVAGGRRPWRRRLGPVTGGAAILAVFVVAGLWARFALPDSNIFDTAAGYQPPSLSAPFGTDRFGRDVFARTLEGAMVSLRVGLSVAVIVALFGLAIGVVSAFDRRIDAVLMRAMDAVMAIPSLLLAIALATIMGAGVGVAIIALAVPEVPSVARVVRSSVLSLKSQPFIHAAEMLGSSRRKIAFRHYLPNLAGPLAVQASYAFAAAMLGEAALSFIGAGAPPDVPSLGNIIAENRSVLQRVPWAIFFPGLCLTILVLTVNMMGDGMRDALDPRARR